MVFDIGGVLEVTPRTAWREGWAARCGLTPGLRPRYRTAILSNSFVGAREREQALYGFEDMCDTIVYSHEVGWRKPDPRIYHAVCDGLGCAPDDAVLLDDVQENIDGARAVGMGAVRFIHTSQAIADLDELMR